MRWLVLVVLSLSTGSDSVVVARPSVLDSLNRQLSTYVQEDSLRVKLLNKMSLRILKVEPRQSLHYAEQALALATRLNDQRGIAEAHNQMAAYYLMQSNTGMALQEAFAAVKIGERAPRLTEVLAASYAILGSIYQHEKKDGQALHYLHMAKQLNHRKGDVLTEGRILNARGLIAVHQQHYDSARRYFQEVLRLSRESHDDYCVPEAINNIGITFSRQNEDERALAYYQQALQAARLSHSNLAQGLALANIGFTLVAQKKYQQAEKTLLQSLRIAAAAGDVKVSMQDYLALGQLKNETGHYEEAHRYLSRLYELKDSLLDVERVKKVAELEIRYETEKKEHAIELLKRDNKIQLLWANMLLTALVLGGVLSIALYYLLESREHKNRLILNLEIEQLTTQHRELSEKYKEVLTSGSVSLESVDQRLLKKAITIIETNMSNPLFGVEQLAEEMSMSRTHLLRKIKAITGFPPSELIRNIRLRKAAALLLLKADSVSQIGFLVGFEDHSYFSKSFKKQFGVAPSEYNQTREEID